ncbi:cell division septum initiation protein DivIVA [Bradyrhizobium sp. LB8.2]|uniref:hypothetical protein n=1 Tax=unclassified Bradyrhizobium TaxID=2631580 RepID=UPI003391D3D1
MRRPIDIAPRNGEDIWVEDAAGAVEAAHWSCEEGKWVWTDGSPIDIAPTHWYPATEDVDPEDEPSGSSLAASVILILAIFVGATLLGVFEPFNARTAQEATRIDGESVVSLGRQAETATNSQAAPQPETIGAPVLAAPASTGRQQLVDDSPRSDPLASELAGARKELDEAVQRTQAAEMATEQLRQSFQQEQAHSAALVDELAGTRSEIETRNQQSRDAEAIAAQQRDAAAQDIAELRRSVEKERDRSAVLEKQVNAAQAATATAVQQRHEAQSRAAALASELAGIPRGPLTPDGAAAEQSDLKGQEIAELRQSLQQERERSAVLVAEAKAARAVTADAEQQRRALEEARAHAATLASKLTEMRREIESRNVQLREAADAASQQGLAAGREIADLRQSLQQERSRADARERDHASAGRPDERGPEQPPAGSMLPTTQNVKVTSAEPLIVSEQNEVEARLIPRARELLDQGNIGAARIVLELAVEKDIARASFMLAETYDPAVLSAWGTYGTRSEAVKARELYAKAQRGGIREAKERLDALHP